MRKVAEGPPYVYISTANRQTSPGLLPYTHPPPSLKPTTMRISIQVIVFALLTATSGSAGARLPKAPSEPAEPAPTPQHITTRDDTLAGADIEKHNVLRESSDSSLRSPLLVLAVRRPPRGLAPAALGCGLCRAAMASFCRALLQS